MKNSTELIETEKDFTKGLKRLGIKHFSFAGNEITAHIYKARTRNKSRKRFLVWFPEHNTCSLVWLDGSTNISDVARHDGKNWYSYADTGTKKVIGKDWKEDSYKELREFAELLFGFHEDLLDPLPQVA